MECASKLLLRTDFDIFILYREFTLAEIEHFVDPSDKSHPKFENVKDVHVTMLPGSYQMSGKPALNITLKEAYDTVSTVVQ